MSKTYKITLTAVFAALTFAATMIYFYIGQGYVNLGDMIIFAAAALIGWYAVPAAIIGSCLADLILAPVYIPATFIIKGVMAIIVLLLTNRRNKQNKPINLIFLFLVFLLSSMFMQVGYVLYELILSGMGQADAAEIFAVAKLLFGMLQTVFCVPLGVLLYKSVCKLKIFKFSDFSGYSKIYDYADKESATEPANGVNNGADDKKE